MDRWFGSGVRLPTALLLASVEILIAEIIRSPLPPFSPRGPWKTRPDAKVRVRRPITP